MYKIEDFNDFLLSEDVNNVILGLIMMKSSLPIKYMTLDGLCELENNIRRLHFNYKGKYNNEIYIIKGKILTKINNQKQKLLKYERLRGFLSPIKVNS